MIRVKFYRQPSIRDFSHNKSSFFTRLSHFQLPAALALDVLQLLVNNLHEPSSQGQHVLSILVESTLVQLCKNNHKYNVRFPAQIPVSEKIEHLWL